MDILQELKQELKNFKEGSMKLKIRVIQYEAKLRVEMLSRVNQIVVTYKEVNLFQCSYPIKNKI